MRHRIARGTAPVLILLVITSLAAGVTAASPQAPAPRGAAPEKVQRAEAGELDTVNAAWWGFDETDATDALQSAIDSGARTVVVPRMETPWIVRPIELRSHLALLFEDGAQVVAKKGEFQGKNDSLFRGMDIEDVTMRGNATLRMRKYDYLSDPYPDAEWRMVIILRSCRDVLVEGLTLADSGGDGLYIGSEGWKDDSRNYCENIVVRDVLCQNNYRQGISVISAKNLLIEDCVLRHTGGTGPSAGLDIEPSDVEGQRLENIVVRNTASQQNDGPGFLVYLKHLNASNADVSIRFENCHVRGSGSYGVAVGAIKDDGPGGRIVFQNCTIRDIAQSGAYIYDKSPDGAELQFIDCTWENVATRHGGLSSPERNPEDQDQADDRPNAPLLLYMLRPRFAQYIGGVRFTRCVVQTDNGGPVLVGAAKKTGGGVRDVGGRIQVRGQGSPRADWRMPTERIRLDIQAK